MIDLSPSLLGRPEKVGFVLERTLALEGVFAMKKTVKKSLKKKAAKRSTKKAGAKKSKKSKK
ncbi:MAG TPA: hypothetical protein VHZ24_13530 [Pirellulales bacterium]|nr:hypothetical protein [Pirellulales bacterium]